MKSLKGIHHVTAIASDAQKTTDFYVGLLGLRLVKKTVNFDDPNSYHLYFGDETGSPGTLITFFVWPGTPKGRIGASEATSIVLEIPKGKFSQQSLADPDGIRIELVESATDDIRIQSVGLNVRDPQKTSALLTDHLGFEPLDKGCYRVGDGYVDLRQGEGGLGMMGAGTIHHIAFRTDDDASQEEWLRHVVRLGLHASPVMDRKYFHSIYFREPSGVLFEIATDPPGMTVDEPLLQLGKGLMLPPQYEAARTQIEAALPAIT